MITYDIATTDHDLYQILELQAKNLPQNISEEESLSQGFVTIHHSFALLKRMNSPYPHIVARDKEKIVGYTLVMLRSFQIDIPLLIPMFQQIDQSEYKGQMLGDAKYFVMGQVCIDKSYRGKGVFTGLYREMQKRMAPHFDFIITEVAERNTRSIRAHFKVGFELVKEYESGEKWSIILLPTKDE